MSNSKGKAIGLIILGFILVMFFFRSPFHFAPFGLISGAWQAVRNVINNGLCVVNGRYWGFPFNSLLTLIFFIIWIWVVIWVYRDAEARRMNGLLWALLVLIGNIIGLIIYLIIRNDYPSPESESQQEPVPPNICPHCDKPVSQNYAFCPSCGNSLKNVCPGCSKEVQDEWKVCPHCGHKLK